MYPVLLSIGPVRVFSYGAMVALGIFLAILLLRSSARRALVDSDTIVDLAITTVLSGFAGARIFYVVQFWDYFQKHPLAIFKIWEGGIVLYGGLIGGLLGFSIFILIRKLHFIRLLDVFVPAMALAQGFGRIGCFLNGCCFGIETNVAWAVSFPFLSHPAHPTQLYEAAFCFLLAGILVVLSRRNPNEGVVSMTYFIAYPAGRFLFEFLRGDNAKVLLHLTASQWISIVIIAATVVLSRVASVSRNGKKTLHSSA